MKYSDRDKAAALAFLDFRTSSSGEKNIKRTAELLEIPERTLNDWDNKRGLSPDVASLREESKKQLSDLIEQKVRNIIDASDDKVPKASLQSAWTSVGIGIDKMLLLRGQPNAITEQQSPKIAEFIETYRQTIAARQAQFPHLTIIQINLQVREEIEEAGLGSLLRLLPEVTEE